MTQETWTVQLEGVGLSLGVGVRVDSPKQRRVLGGDRVVGFKVPCDHRSDGGNLGWVRGLQRETRTRRGRPVCRGSSGFTRVRSSC